MKPWQVWDAAFPVCPWRGRAEKLARQTFREDPGVATVTRYKFGWWVEFADNPRCRFVHRGSGVVYYHTGAAPDRTTTEAYFARYSSPRKVWTLRFPHDESDSVALVRSIADIVSSYELLPKIHWVQEQNRFGKESVAPWFQDNPWFYGSFVAVDWLKGKFSSSGINCEIRLSSRKSAKHARLFRLSCLRMSLADAFHDNGKMWHGQSAECLFEEAPIRS